MKNLTFIVLSTLVIITGCATTPATTMTPLEIQSMQTREYEVGKDIVFPSVMSVFQDLGYTVKSADKSTGLITAESAAQSSAAMKFWLGVSSVKQTAATAFIEEIGGKTKVRLNFVNTKKESYLYGQSDRNDKPILDAKVYMNAFDRIESAIFIRSN